MIKKALASAKQNVIDIRLYLYNKRAVALHADFLVCAIVSDHVDERLRQFVAVLLVNPSLNGEDIFGKLETVDVVPSVTIVAIAREESAVVNAIERKTEVIALRI